MPGIGVITNPKAKRNINRPWIREALERIVGDAGRVYETRSIDELPRVAEEFIERDLDVLAVNGGDGTTHIAITNFIPVYGDRPLPKLLSLRGGTMNTISKSIKHKGTCENILASIVKKVRNDEPLDIVYQPTLKINDRYGFLWGYGVVGNFLEAYYKGTTLGTVQAVKVVSRIIFSAIFRTQFAKDLFAPSPTRLTIDGKTMDLPDCRVVLSAAIKEFGLGAKLTYRAYEKPGHIHLRATEKTPFRIVPWIPNLFMGRPIPGIMDEVVTEFVAETEKKMPYTIDGELYRDTKIFRVRAGPIIRVIREGVKKPPKGIGFQEDAEANALTETVPQGDVNKDLNEKSSLDTEPFLRPMT